MECHRLVALRVDTGEHLAYSVRSFGGDGIGQLLLTRSTIVGTKTREKLRCPGFGEIDKAVAASLPRYGTFAEISAVRALRAV